MIKLFWVGVIGVSDVRGDSWRHKHLPKTVRSLKLGGKQILGMQITPKQQYNNLWEISCMQQITIAVVLAIQAQFWVQA